MPGMSDEEWLQKYPEDWRDADEAEGYDPNQYQLVWNSNYTKFRPIKLHWNDQASYLRFQGDGDGFETD